ncbi:MAG TPA: MFS transporter [Chloroflexia bacterium]|nr:MFS transporter [Chloroflexia bacterium]
MRYKPSAVIPSVLGALIVMLLIWAGSRGLKDFDSALIGYAVATILATAALAFRYSLWITRPPTKRYFKAGWGNFLSLKNFRRYFTLVPKALWTDIFAQTFIWRRSKLRWTMHMSIFWGVLISCLITFPLTFGWLRFTLIPPDHYQTWVFGIPVFQFRIENWLGFMIFHGLDFSAVLLILGLIIAFWRRTTDAGLLVTQRFSFDIMPLVLLLSIAVTGLALTASSLWWEGRFYWFISLVHQVVVVAWLLSLAFGKFFHIIERPASIGVTIYQAVNQDVEHYDYGPKKGSGQCARCGDELPSQQFVTDLTGVLQDVGQRYDLGERGLLQEYCPTCKRVLRGQAYYQLMGKHFL